MLTCDEELDLDMIEKSENDVEATINWVEANRGFLKASFEGKLDQWVKSNLRKNTPERILIDSFVVDFNEALEKSIDIRSPKEFPCPIACFVDSIVGMSSLEGRNPNIGDVLNNQLLRRFLHVNEVVTEVFAGYIKTDEMILIIAKWNYRESKLVGNSMQKLFQQPDILDKSLPTPGLQDAIKHQDGAKRRKVTPSTLIMF